MIKKIKENGVHDSLKRGRCCCKSERHHSKLKRAVATGEAGLHSVAHADRYLMIPVAHVELAKYLRAIKALQQLVYPWQRIDVTARLTIQGAIVYAHTEAPILLFSKEDRRSVCAVCNFDSP